MASKRICESSVMSFLERKTFETALPSDAVQRMNALWLDVKAAGTNTTVYLTAAAAALAALAALTVFLRLRRRRRLARRGISRRA